MKEEEERRKKKEERKKMNKIEIFNFVILDFAKW